MTTTTKAPARPTARGTIEPESVRNLKDFWYIATTSSAVKDQPVGTVILGEPVVVFRNNNGEVAAFEDRCLHRNAQLSKGQVIRGSLACPYHGWTYNSKGKCVAVPSEGRAPSSDLRLRSYPVQECHGFVWVFMGRANLADGIAPFEFPAAGRGWKSYTMVTEFSGNVTNLVENFMDIPHTAFVHRGWFRKPGQRRLVHANVVTTPASVEVEYDRPDDQIGVTGWIFNPGREPMQHTDRFFMPNCTRVDYTWGTKRHFIITSQVTPHTETSATVYTTITFTFPLINTLSRMFLPWYTRRVINQDVGIMRNQTRNLERFGEARFHGTEADVIHEQIEMLRTAAERKEPTAVGTREQRISFWI